MHIPFSATNDFSQPDNLIKDYEINKDVGVSYQELTSNGPKSGRYLNNKVHEVYFIIRGTGTFFVGDESYSVAAKDIVVVEPGKPHRIETSDLVYLTITTPDWYEEQAEHVE